MVQICNRLRHNSEQDVVTQTAKYAAIYRKVVSKRDPLPIHVDKAGIPDNIPSDGEPRAVGCAVVMMGLQAEHISMCGSRMWWREEEAQSDVGLGHK